MAVSAAATMAVSLVAWAAAASSARRLAGGGRGGGPWVRVTTTSDDRLEKATVNETAVWAAAKAETTASVVAGTRPPNGDDGEMDTAAAEDDDITWAAADDDGDYQGDYHGDGHGNSGADSSTFHLVTPSPSPSSTQAAAAEAASATGRYYFPHWTGGGQLNNQLARVVVLLQAARLAGGVVVVPPVGRGAGGSTCPVIAWLDRDALADGWPSVEGGAFLDSPAGRRLIDAGLIRMDKNGCIAPGRRRGGGGDASGTVAVLPNWVRGARGGCGDLTRLTYVGVNTLDGGGAGRTADPSAPATAGPNSTRGADGDADGSGDGDPPPFMGLFSSGAFHYCARRLEGWLPAWRSIRPHPALAAAAAAYVAAVPAPFVAVHVRDLEDGRDPAVLAAVDGVAAEVDAALGAYAGEGSADPTHDDGGGGGVDTRDTGSIRGGGGADEGGNSTCSRCPPRTVYVAAFGDAPQRVRLALAARLAAAGGWRSRVTVVSCADVPGCPVTDAPITLDPPRPLPPPPSVGAATPVKGQRVATTTATATATSTDAATAAAVAADAQVSRQQGAQSRQRRRPPRPVGTDSAAAAAEATALLRASPDGAANSHAGVAMLEMSLGAAADFFLGTHSSTMSLNIALMRAAGGTGVGGGGAPA
ncbi:hypothetical protein MMPV_008360 [Pyropia vietnamensis]